MPAIITVLGGHANRADCWIEEEVLRVGSDAAAQIVVSELPPHALTIRYQGGRYLAIPRGACEVWIDGQPVSGVGQVWRPGQLLQVGAAIALRLRVDGDATPTPRPSPTVSGSQAGSRPAAAADAGTRRAVQLLIVAACVAIIAILLLSDSSAAARRVASPRATFETLVRELVQREQNPRTAQPEWRRLVQEARFHELRGDGPAALARYGLLRDQLLAGRTAAGQLPTEFDAELLAFVKDRLQSLGAFTTARGGFRR